MTTNIPSNILEHLRRQHGLVYFVETGTAGGATATLMAPLFEKVWTVELLDSSATAAEERLRRFPNVTVRRGGSPEFLRWVMPLLDKPALIWLDAHWCGGQRLGPECPLLEELDAIGGLSGGNVILIDDARLFVKPPPPPHRPEEWPTLKDIKEKVKDWGVRVDVLADVILIEKK